MVGINDLKENKNKAREGERERSELLLYWQNWITIINF